MDIFKGWDDYTKRIEKNWRAVVSDEDAVIIPGDISWAMYLDEIDGTLDSKNRDSFINILNKQIDKLGLEQVFVISHNKALYAIIHYNQLYEFFQEKNLKKYIKY